jgi:hypothetical protein
LVTCAFAGVCPDGTVKNTCAWLRTGEYDYSDYWYDLYFNSFPDHCYYALTNPPQGYELYTWYETFNDAVWNYYLETDLEVNPSYAYYFPWNVPFSYYSTYSPTEGGAQFNTVLNTQTDLDVQLCDNAWAKYQYLDPDAFYEVDE